MIIQASQRAAFIDRDGVLNDLVYRGRDFRRSDGELWQWTAPFHREELCLKPDVQEALEIIGRKGYLRILVTNQPDVALGHIDPHEFEVMMDIFHQLPLDDICVCRCHPGEECWCRKPQPGMLLSARDKHRIDMSASYMIGDMETDIQAGRAAGVRTIRIASQPSIVTQADHRVLSIMEAARLLP